jgi:HSP20 family protein
MLMRFDPFRELDRLTDELWGGVNRSTSRVFPMDAYRRGDRFFVHFDLPGIDASSIDLTVEKNVLTVKAERTWSPMEGDEVVVSERPTGTFTRQLFLGETLDAGHLAAHYDNGVLTLEIPVAEAAKPRKVDIKVGESSAKAIEAESTDAHAA